MAEKPASKVSSPLPNKGLVDSAIAKVYQIVDRVFPPTQREKWWSQFKEFAVSNPKITAFLLANIVLSGPPLLLFIVFTVTVFLIALVTGLIIGLLGAILFTVFMVLVALLVVLPTLFITTFAATFLAIWAIGGYYIIKWFNEGKSPGEIGSAIGDKLSTLTGGSLNWLMSAARSVEQLPAVQQAQTTLGGAGNGMSTGKFSEPSESTTKRTHNTKDTASHVSHEKHG